MTLARRMALGLLLAVAAAGAGAGLLAPAGYEHQFRENPDAPPSARFPLGTDELGRDRLARLLYGSRVSLLLAPATAALATGIALVLALVSGFFGGRLGSAILAGTDLMGSVPLLFLLIGLRALLPLDVAPMVSVGVTFALLGLCGWTSGVRVLRAAVLQVKSSAYMRQGIAAGCRRPRLLVVHAAAGLWPVISAQFWLMVPQFLVAEANLGALGLGITEPLPSWGNLLTELQNYAAIADAPWRLAPAVLLAGMLGCFQILLQQREVARL